jgi:hypothetical protein
VTRALAGVKRYIGALALAFALLALGAAIAKYSQTTTGPLSAGDGIDFSHVLFGLTASMSLRLPKDTAVPQRSPTRAAGEGFG